MEETGEGIKKRDVIREYMKARDIAFKEETILQVWKKSGIRPINPGIFTEEDYAPSYESSTQLHLPATFPVNPNSDSPLSPLESDPLSESDALYEPPYENSTNSDSSESDSESSSAMSDDNLGN